MAIENTTPIETPTPSLQVAAATDDAKQDFERVSQVLHDGGAREAYKVLKEESDNTQGLSPEEKQAWQKEMSEQLSQEHAGKESILPRLSLAYLESNRGTFAQKGMFSADKIETRKHINEMGLQLEDLRPDRDIVNDVDATLLNGLAFSPEERIQKSLKENKDFSVSRLKGYLDQDKEDSEEASKIERSDRTEAEVGALLLKDDGKMFDLFDTRFGSQDGDGKINIADMTAVTEMLDKNPLLKDRFTAEEQRALDGLKSVFADPNNLDDERQDSILKHDGFGQFMYTYANVVGFGSGGLLPVDRYYVTRHSIAHGTQPQTATEAVAGAAPRTGSTIETAVSELVESGQPAEGIQFPGGSDQGSLPVEGLDQEHNVITEPDSLDDTNPGAITYDPEGVDAHVSRLTAVERGDGYWHVARRLLAYVGNETSNAKILALTNALQAANGSKMLHPADDLYSMLGNEQVKALLNS